MTKFDAIRRARPIEITTTTYAPKATAAKQSGATTRSASWNSGGPRICTSQGDSRLSPVATQAPAATTYVSTKPYVRLASSSSLIEYANAGQASRNAQRKNTSTA